jgi:hypothetical protein
MVCGLNPLILVWPVIFPATQLCPHQRPGFKASAVTTAKFLSPLLPDEVFSIRLEAGGRDIRFECHAADRVLARGSIRSADEAGDHSWAE